MIATRVLGTVRGHPQVGARGTRPSSAREAPPEQHGAVCVMGWVPESLKGPQRAVGT
jgi:hypothetical protein